MEGLVKGNWCLLHSEAALGPVKLSEPQEREASRQPASQPAENPGRRATMVPSSFPTYATGEMDEQPTGLPTR